MAVDTNVTDYDNILLRERVLSTLSYVNLHVAGLIIVDFMPKKDSVKSEKLLADRMAVGRNDPVHGARTSGRCTFRQIYPSNVKFHVAQQTFNSLCLVHFHHNWSIVNLKFSTQITLISVYR